jgi:hypothetical protein
MLGHSREPCELGPGRYQDGQEPLFLLMHWETKTKAKTCRFKDRRHDE